MIGFAWPWVLLVLPLPWLFRRLLPPAPFTQGAALRVPFMDDIRSLSWRGDRGGVKSINKYAVWFAWLALVTAAARPEFVGEAVPLPVGGRDLVLAVDISGSMEQADFSIRGQRVTRLGVVKAVASDFIERRQGDRLGLVLFGARAYLQTPLTFDRKTVAAMLQEAEIGLAGKQTAIGDAIGLALKRMRKSEKKERVLILLTDGANTGGTMSPLRAAQLAANDGLRIYTIGIGSEKVSVDPVFGTRVINPASDLDENTLFAIADVTRGAYFRAGDTESLQRIYDRLDELEPMIDETNVFRPTRTLYVWPLGLALLISVGLALRRLPWFVFFRTWHRRAAEASP